MKQVGEEELEALCWTGGRGSMADPPFASQKQVRPGTAWQVPPCLVFWVLCPYCHLLLQLLPMHSQMQLVAKACRAV